MFNGNISAIHWDLVCIQTEECGGGEIYLSFLPYCKNLYLTKVHKEFKGDTSFPEINLSEWNITYSSGENISISESLKFEFINLTKAN